MANSTTAGSLAPFLRVGVDGFNLALSRGTGIASYARALTFALKAMGLHVDVLYGLDAGTASDPILDEALFFDKLGEGATLSGKPRGLPWSSFLRRKVRPPTVHEIPVSPLIDKRPLADRLPAFTRLLNAPGLYTAAATHFRRTGHFLNVEISNPPDIQHWTYPLPIKIVGARNVYTLHDLIPLQMPYTTTDNKSLYHNLIRCICRESSGICTVSEFSRKQILSFFPEAADKIHNTYQSALDVYGYSPDVERQGFLGLTPGEYFIFCGSLEPKKNVARVIEAFLMTESRRKLVVVGAMAWRSDAEQRFLQSAVSTGRIIHLEYLPRQSLVTAIRSACAMLFPSLSEGFGLPVLEAMALGTPTLTSREGGLPEVAGDAAIYVDAYDVTSISAGIEHIDRDQVLQEQLRRAGLRQAEKFSLAQYQARLHEFYDRILLNDI